MDQSISDSDNSSGYNSDTDMYMDPIDGWRALQCSKPSEHKYTLFEYSDSESDTEFDIDMSEYDSESDAKQNDIEDYKSYKIYDSNVLEEAERELRSGISQNLESLIHSHDMKPSSLVSTKHNSLYNYLNQLTEANYGMISVGVFYDQYVKYNADSAITLTKVALGRMLNKYGITTIRHRLGNLYHINKDAIDAWNINFAANAHV